MTSKAHDQFEAIKCTYFDSLCIKKCVVCDVHQVVLHYQSLTEPARIRRLISQLHKNTGEVVKKNPR